MIDKENRNALIIYRIDFIGFEKTDVLQMFDDMNEFIYEIEKFINKE